MEHTTITPDSNHADIQRVYGFNFAETGGSDAVVEMRVAAVGGTVVRYVNLGPGETATLVLGKPIFLSFPGGCYIKVVSGTISGVLDH